MFSSATLPSRLMRSNRNSTSGAVRMFYWLRSHVGMTTRRAHYSVVFTFN